jgi:predicted pyridoxine 5'-phosphate oxidase superfamily flavin-nucleotide-binding protein
MEGTADKLARAMNSARKARYVLLATVDEAGAPRLTPVQECRPAGTGRVAVRAWLDVPGLEGPGQGRLALAFWEEQGHGYQLTGRLVRLQEAAVLDGLAEIEQQVHFPQIERTILIQVDSVEEFHFGITEPPLR